MSVGARKFLERNNIKLEDLEQSIYEAKDINQILDRYRVSTRITLEQICVRDILGYDYSWRGESNNLLNSFYSYFDTAGDTYHSRANGMLEYDSSEIVDKLGYSFRVEPIEVDEIEHGMYIISNNGIHRFNILKVSYLGELGKCDTDEEKKVIDSKFTIPVKVQKADVFKSYCNYLLNNFGNEKVHYWLSCDKNDSSLCRVRVGTEEMFFNEEQLGTYVKKNISSEFTNDPEIIYFSQKYSSFGNFMSDFVNDKNNQK